MAGKRGNVCFIIDIFVRIDDNPERVISLMTLNLCIAEKYGVVSVYNFHCHKFRINVSTGKMFIEYAIHNNHIKANIFIHDSMELFAHRINHLIGVRGLFR